MPRIRVANLSATRAGRQSRVPEAGADHRSPGRPMHRRSSRPLAGLLGPVLGCLLLTVAAGSASAQAPEAAPAPAADSVPPAAELPPVRGLTLEALRADPERYRGRSIVWRGQFLAVQRADSLRTDLRAGETYVLAREPNGEPGYLYGVVPPGLLEAVRSLAPLERVELLGRVRTARSPLMGYPVVDLERIVPLRSEASSRTLVRLPSPYPLEYP